MSTTPPVLEQVGPEHWQVTYTEKVQRTRSFWKKEAAEAFAAKVSESGEKGAE